MSLESKKRPVEASEPDQVVATYLETLLSEVEEHRELPGESPATGLETAPANEPEMQAESGAVIPVWAQEPFQCLLFKVRGLTLAIPLVTLNSIAEWRDKTTSLPGHPDWHLGVLEHRGEKVGVVDTIRLVMPERAEKREMPEQHGHRLLIIGDGRWGLKCDKLLDPVTLESDDVRWRSCRESNPWVVGTLPEQLCILLDVDALVEMIDPDISVTETPLQA